MAEEEVSREAFTLVHNVLGTFTFGASQKQRYAVFKTWLEIQWMQIVSKKLKLVCVMFGPFHKRYALELV